MSLLRSIRLQLRALFRNGRHQSDLDEEMQSHLDQLIDDFKEEGLTEEESRKRAIKEFGNLEFLKEETRDSWGVLVVTNLVQDIRYSSRSLWKAKGFSLAVVVTLALCMGANTSVFSVLYEVVLKSLPFENSNRIVQLFRETGERTLPGSSIGWQQYLDYKERPDLFEAVSITEPSSRVLGEAEIDGRVITHDYYEVMQVRPLIGRFHDEEEQEAGKNRVLVLTHTAWEVFFDSDPEVIGQEIEFLNEAPFTIIGVAPRSMESIDSRVRFFIPKVPRRDDLDPQRRAGWIYRDLWARLKPGVSHELVSAELGAIEELWYEDVANPLNRKRFEGNRPSFTVDRPNPLESRLELLQLGALLVLLVGCSNIVNLMFSRANRRVHELSIRHSFGAGRGVLCRLLLIESGLLSLVGAVLGFVIAWMAFSGVNRYLAVVYPQLVEVSFGGVFWLSLVLVAGLMSLMMGLLPLLVVWRSGKLKGIDGSTKSSSVSSGSRLLSSGLVVSQIAFTCALLIGAGLLFRSFSNVMAVNPGFDSTRVVSGVIKLQGLPHIKTKPDRLSKRNEILDALRTIPGVESVAFEASLTGAVGKFLQMDPIAVRDTAFEGLKLGEQLAVVKHVSLGYFQTMGIPIMEGRSFLPGDSGEFSSDATDPPSRFIIDQSFVEKYLEGKSGTEAYVKWAGMHTWWTPVVGVSGRANLEGLEERDGDPVLYMCADTIPFQDFAVLLRTERGFDSLIGEVRTTLKALDPTLHLYEAGSVEMAMNRLHLDRQALTLLIVAFAVLALVLSGVGIYGVLAYDVEQRQREIGIRLAMGADRGVILGLVLKQGLLKTGAGLAIGLLASLYLSSYLESRLFDVTALDPITYFVSLMLLLAIALCASYLPARRAVRVYPIKAIQVE